MPENKAIGKIGGGMFILILVILFFAAHGGSNEMMYLTLLFVFIVILLFSYGFWSSVSKGEGIWQYWGKQNLQHQQITNPNYHYPTFGDPNRPKPQVHICAPPKMGGARLNIYTIPSERSASGRRNSSIESSYYHSARRQSSTKNKSRQNSVKKEKEEETNDEKVNAEVYLGENGGEKDFVEITINGS